MLSFPVVHSSFRSVYQIEAGKSESIVWSSCRLFGRMNECSESVLGRGEPFNHVTRMSLTSLTCRYTLGLRVSPQQQGCQSCPLAPISVSHTTCPSTDHPGFRMLLESWMLSEWGRDGFTSPGSVTHLHPSDSHRWRQSLSSIRRDLSLEPTTDKIRLQRLDNCP